MTDNHHPITPPSELVDQWRAMPEYADISEKFFLISITTNKLQDIATQAARWGADQELEACCEFLDDNELCDPNFHKDLRATRRPKPPSKKQRGLSALKATNLKKDDPLLYQEILNAIEGLPND